MITERQITPQFDKNKNNREKKSRRHGSVNDSEVLSFGSCDIKERSWGLGGPECKNN